MTTTSIPAAVATTIATLRTVAYWFPDEQRTQCLDAAHAAEVAWDGGCCPICEETYCDGGCPLEEVRARLYDDEVVQADNATFADYEQSRRSTAASLRTMIGSLDPDSPLETALGGVVGCLAQQLEAPTPFGDRRPERPVLSEGCYDASFGRVHVLPSCRCPR